MADTQIYYLFKRVALRFSIFIGLLLLFLFSCTSQKEKSAAVACRLFNG